MLASLSGATRLYVIVGDPIAQVSSPGGMTKGFAAHGHDGVLVPVQISAAGLPAFFAAADKIQNLHGIVVTIPHKFAAFRHCTTTTERARFMGVANILRRSREGGWHGDSVDGLGFTGAVRAKGFDLKGKRALLIGAGGAGSAIAHALLLDGVRELAIYADTPGQSEALAARLNTLGAGHVTLGTPDPTGYDLVCNATPAGMKPDDPLPVDMAKLVPTTFAGCVITKPDVSPFIAAARAQGCATSTGTDMYNALQSAMLDFLLAPPRHS